MGTFWDRLAGGQGKTAPAQDQLYRQRSLRLRRTNTQPPPSQPPPISPTRPPVLRTRAPTAPMDAQRNEDLASRTWFARAKSRLFGRYGR